MGTGTGIALPDGDMMLILAVMALLYREGGDKKLLLGLMFLLISIAQQNG